MNVTELILKLLTGKQEQFWLGYTGVEVTPEEYELLSKFRGNMRKTYWLDDNPEHEYEVRKTFSPALFQADGKYYAEVYGELMDRLVQVADYFDGFRTCELFQLKEEE